METTPWNGTGNRTVVVPGINAPSTVACLRSLGRRGIRTIVVSSEETTPAFRSRYCDESVLVPSPHDDLVAYKEALRSLAMRPDVCTIVPVREPDVYVLSRYRDEFREHVATPWPQFDTLARVQDRVRLFEAAESAGVSVPETTLFTALPDADREWIVKPRYSILGDAYLDRYTPETCVAPPSTRYLEFESALASAPAVGSGTGAAPSAESDGGTVSTTTDLTERLRSEMHHVPVVQQYIPTTDEYGFFALYDRGEPVATFQHRQRRGWSYAGGPSAYRESTRIPALENAGRALLDHLDWHGLAMVEFLRDESTGEFKLMEVNPRFWSSLPFTVQTGADFPYYYWLLASGQRSRIDHDYRSDIGGHLLRGELLYLHSVLVDDVPLVEKPDVTDALADVVRSLVDQPRFDYLSRDDPLPFVRDLVNTIGEIRD
ncbi:carboxylate--amine ligase [Halopiger djelfimassiliensis]|uniref:carboxylate--amine ligase n=1 Tax=Halopiger djelfimassiliensis TaxID=1293047 RepID=UPI000677EF5C|nr:carboxylate--amine ligase [Halopiger djelfimassiliensis]